MLKNYLKVILRNFTRNKGYTFINIGGLAVGLAASIFILLWVYNELTYDRFHSNSERIAKVSMTWVFDQTQVPVAPTVTAVGPDLQESLPQVEQFVRLKSAGSVMVGRDDQVFRESRFFHADTSFFQVFSFNLVVGDPATALVSPHSVIMTRSASRKYFGSSNPIGQTLTVNNSEGYEVTGIVEDPPVNSHIQFDFIASFTSLPEADDRSWNNSAYHTYLLLASPGNLEGLQAQVDAYVADYFGDFANKPLLHVVPFEEVYLYSPYPGELSPGGDITYIYIFFAIAILVLVIACINYMNLATARAVERAKEVGIRKVIGANRPLIALQFLGEALISSLLAMILAVGLLQVSMSLFNEISGRELMLSGQPYLWLALAGIWLAVGLLSGLYPAFALSRYQPVQVLKGPFRSGRSGVSLRKGLVVFQFAISCFLILSTLIVSSQLKFIQQKDLGYEKEQVVVLPVDVEMRQNQSLLTTLKNQLVSGSSVQSVGLAANLPINGVAVRTIQTGDNPDSRQLMNFLEADDQLIETLKLDLIAGSDFNDAIDPEQEFAVILNETAASHFGWTVEEAVGQVVHSSNYGENGRVYGVVRDFHYESMYKAIDPLAITYYPGYARHLLVRVEAGDLAGTLATIGSVWEEVIRHRPFEYSFLDDRLNSVYQVEQRIWRIFSIFSILAIVIASLGLFGLASYATVQKTREIGIRKVLGASAGNIMALLSRDFIKLVALGFLIAVPVGWYAMNMWLSSFAFRIEISPLVFFVAGGSLLLIALLTVSWQSLRAALMNPIDSLKSE